MPSYILDHQTLSGMFVALAAVLILSLIVVAYLDRKNIVTASDFLLHGEKLSTSQLVSTLVAANLSLGNMIFVCAIFGYAYAWSGVFWMAATISALMIGFLILGKGFKSYIESKNNFGSVHDYIGRMHSGGDQEREQSVRKIASIISSVSLYVAIIVEIHLAATFSSFITNADESLIVLMISSFVAVFSMTTGFRSVVITDIIQAILLLAAIAAGLAFFYQVPQSGSIFDKEGVSPLSIASGIGPYAPIGLLVLGFGWLLCTPDTWQRNCCARRLDISMKGTFIGGLIMIASVTVFAVAGYEVKASIESLVSENPLYSNGSYPISDIFLYKSPGLFGTICQSIMAIGLVMAAISTTNTFIVVIAHAISVDFSPAMKNLHEIPKTSGIVSDELIFRSRFIMAAVGFLSVVGWYFIHDKFIHDPINIFFVTYSVQFALLVPVLLGRVSRLQSYLGAKWSILFSSILTVIVGISAMISIGKEALLLGLNASDWLSLLPAITVLSSAIAYVCGMRFQARGLRV